jgi:chaperonin GroEL
MKKEVLFKAAMRPRVKRGIDIACDAIKTTIGAKGRNAFIDDPLQPKITNDGVTIAKAISLPDKFENMGAWLVKNTSSQTNDAAGDGTSTTAVLLQEKVRKKLSVRLFPSIPKLK